MERMEAVKKEGRTRGFKPEIQGRYISWWICYYTPHPHIYYVPNTHPHHPIYILHPYYTHPVLSGV